MFWINSHSGESFFLSLLQIAIGTQETLDRTPSAEEWEEVFQIAQEQGVLCVCCPHIEEGMKTNKGEDALANLPRKLLLMWLANCLKQETLNHMVSLQCCKVEAKLEGPNICILKGQGIGSLYYRTKQGRDLSLRRTSGDIDVWKGGGIETLLPLARSLGSTHDFDYKHIKLPKIEDTLVELHWRPVTLTNSFADHRLQKYLEERKNEMCEQVVRLPEEDIFYHTPSLRLNRLIILVHCYGHFLWQGIGMRQILDYYFVAQMPISDAVKAEEQLLLKQLGMEKFASAMAWILLLLDPDFTVSNLPAEPNEKEGQFLWTEMIEGGNFGHADERKDASLQPFDRKDMMQGWWNRSRQLMAHYPKEVACWPLWKMQMFLWKRKQKQ